MAVVEEDEITSRPGLGVLESGRGVCHILRDFV